MDAPPVAAEATKQPTVAVRPALRFVAIPLAFVCALLIMGGQVRLGHQQTTLALCHNESLTTVHCVPPQIGLDLFCDIGLASIVGLTVIFHFIDRRVTSGGWSSSMFLGPVAALFFDWTVLVLAALNVLFALRYFMGVETMVKTVYGVTNQTIIDILIDCGRSGNTFSNPIQRCPTLISSFLSTPAPVYIHVLGGIVTLGVGPFQLSSTFRKSHPLAHRRMGYIYALAVVVGTAGSLGMMVTAASGWAITSGFFVLAVLWLHSIIHAIRHIRNKRILEHRCWAVRNYSYTAAAIYFRFLPMLVFQITTISPTVSYVIGGWLSLFISIVIGEIYVKKIRLAAASSVTSSGAEASLGRIDVTATVEHL